MLITSTLAAAATLPGIAVPFDVTSDGRWVLADDLPQALADAGAEPGWELREVDGIPFDDPDEVMRRIANGPARPVQLTFWDAPEGGAEEPAETLVVASRSPLVRVREVAFLEWPDGVQTPVGDWQDTWGGAPAVLDERGRPWVVDPVAGGVRRGRGEPWAAHTIPEVFWARTGADWVFDAGRSVERRDPDAARSRLDDDGARLAAFRESPGEHVVVKEERGVRVYAVDFPEGTPTLPVCQPRVPETCLTAGRQILQELGRTPGGPEEALRQLGVACANGVHRACYESVALEEPDWAPRVSQCLDGDVGACFDVATHRFGFSPDEPDDLVIGLLEFSCELEGSGTLGDRLRRLDDVGASCSLLADAYAARGMPDLALLNLDHACVLGRAEACTKAEERREAAFAARSVRECQDPEAPIAASCVELGRILQESEVQESPLDAFDALLRGCALGAVDGCIELGDYVDRWGIEHPRVQKAEAELRASCQQGEQRACVGQAHLLVRQEPRTEGYGQALRLFAAACEAGSVEGCIAGARQRRIGEAKRVGAPPPEGLWAKACDRGEAEGCAGLGERLEKERELAGAFDAWSQACELGDSHSCSELGQLVQRSHRPWPDEQPATQYLERGCESGDPAGCFWLAEEQGLPRKGEPGEEVYVLLDRSCDGEHGPGCERLAEVHLDRKTNFDDEIAARHLETACYNGTYSACRTLGQMYARGKGVERDRQKAGQLLDLFRYNERRRHLRIGLGVGMPYGLGLDGEVVVPVPIGPAVSVGGHAAYIPGAGTALRVLDGQPATELPALTMVGLNARLYPNPQARGLYGSVGWHQLRAVDEVCPEGDDRCPRTRVGFNARVGLRSQSGATYTSLEVGLGTFGVVRFQDFDDERGENEVLPLILPALGFSMGFAAL